MKTGTPTGTRLALLLVAPVVALALLSCAPPRPAASPPYPALGTVVTLADGRVRATGVVARYPVTGLSGVSSDWALYSALGSETAPLGVVAALEPRPHGAAVRGLSPSSNTTDPLAPFDGRLVTVEGTMTSRPVSFGRSFPPWLRLELTSIATAPPEAQARVAWEGALVQPGRWFDEPWRYDLAGAYEGVETAPGDGYYDLSQAEKAYGSRIPTPMSPLVGRLVGVVLDGTHSDDPPGRWRLLYASGLGVSGPERGPWGRGADGIFSMLKAGEGSSSYEHLVHVNGQPGLIGEMDGLPTPSHYLFFWDGKQIVHVGYGGLGKAPTEQDLLEIAASMSP
jgi:hypothetical protein